MRRSSRGWPTRGSPSTARTGSSRCAARSSSNSATPAAVQGVVPGSTGSGPPRCSPSVAGTGRRRTGSESSRWSAVAVDDVELPLPRHALQRRPTVLTEPQSRADDEVLHRARHEDLAGTGLVRHAGADVDGDAPDLPVDQLDLTRVHPGPHLEPEIPDRLLDRGRAPDGPRR